MSLHSIGVPVTSYTFSVCIDNKLGRPLGLFFNDNKFHSSLFVEHVSSDTSTLIGEWNAKNPDAMICNGDHVVAVNDKKGMASHLRQMTKTLVLLELTVKRIMRPPEPHLVHPTAIRRVAEVFHCFVLNSFTALYSHFAFFRFSLGYSSAVSFHSCVLILFSFYNPVFLLCAINACNSVIFFHCCIWHIVSYLAILMLSFFSKSFNREGNQHVVVISSYHLSSHVRTIFGQSPVEHHVIHMDNIVFYYD